MKKTLAIGIIFLFLFSTLAPMMVGIKVEPIENNEISDEFFLTNVSIHPWPMLGQNSRHTGLSLYDTINNPGKLKWRYKTNSINSIIRDSPVIANDGTIYIGSFRCLNAVYPNGTIKWEFNTNYDISSTPALDDDGNIYFISYNKLYSVYSNGTLKWSFECEDETDFDYCSPTIGPDSTIYILTSSLYSNINNYLYALTPNGTLKWKFMTSPNILQFSSPAIGENNIIYFSTDNSSSNKGSYFYALYPNGTIYWKYEISDLEDWRNINTPMIGFDNTIYFTISQDYNSWFYALNSDGTLKWKNNQMDDLDTTPVISSDGIIYVIEEKSLNDMVYGYLHAFNPDGTLKWSYKAGSYHLNSPSIGLEGTIYVPGIDSDEIGYIFAINSNGNLIWKLNLDNWPNNIVFSQPAIGLDGTIYFGSYDGNLYAIGIPLDNKPPLKPEVKGPKRCLPYQSIQITSNTTDPDGDEICYYFLYNDSYYWPERTIRRIPENGYLPSGTEVKFVFYGDSFFEEIIRVKVRDIHGYDSEESVIKINPRTRSIYNFNWLDFLERFPILDRLLDSLDLYL